MAKLQLGRNSIKGMWVAKHFCSQQSSESSSKRHHVKASTDCFTELRVCLEPAGNPAHVTAQSFPAEGSEQSFQQLLPEFSSQESQHADLPSIYSIEARGTSQSMEIYNYSEPTEILQDKKSVHFQPPTENLSTVCGSSDDVAVFDQLQLQHSTPCGSTSSECSMKQLGSREEMLGFEELSRTVVTGSQSQRLTEDESGALNPHEETDSKGTPLSTENERSVQNIIKTETTKAVRQAQCIMNLESFSSSIPVWETESGYGIMEEPDLTLLSISDLSITETDLANLTLEEKDSGGQNSFQAGASPSPLPDTSGHGVASEEPCVDQAQVAPSATGTTRKKSFMERSYQRQREMRNKAQLPQTGSSVSRLKGVSKVRVSLPEDRKTSQALMHQRALRLYRQLTEVKKQREEKAKQELCAQNRARAKEFHKKTLEKLRAKNTC